MIFLRHHTTGDGLITALQFLEVMRRTGRRASELASIVTMTPQTLINVTVARKPPIEEVAPLRAAIGEAERRLGDEGRVLVRYSGTQSMCRVMVEGPTEEVTASIAESLAGTVRRALG
jgi:phosphoglucosamine mutase